MADEPQLIDEIQRLNNSFGIGLIKLNPEIIDESEIIFASRINNELDWDTIDRLAEDNKDFNCFIQDVIEDIQIGKIKGSYDIPMNDEKLIAFMKEKEII